VQGVNVTSSRSRC